MEMVILIAVAVTFGPTLLIITGNTIAVLCRRHDRQPPNGPGHHLFPYTERWLKEHPRRDRATDLLVRLHLEIRRNQHPEHIEAIESDLQTELAREDKYWYFVPLEQSR